jgi:hypothetical protein
MKTNNYLYGDEVSIPEIPQAVIDERISLLKSHLALLLCVDYRERDQERYNAVLKAIRFWETINEDDK